jgi:ribosomal-protein-alanine N-acetyltransferase
VRFDSFLALGLRRAGLTELLLQPFVAPSDGALRLATERLDLEPLVAAHAPEMHVALADPAIYLYLPSDPPQLTDLHKTYEYSSRRLSPDGSELWLNWAVRPRATGLASGYLQATVRGDASALLAYVLHPNCQGQGFASEGLREVCRYLEKSWGIQELRIEMDTRNRASIRLAERLGFVLARFRPQADFFKGSSSDEYLYVRRIHRTGPPDRT